MFSADMDDVLGTGDVRRTDLLPAATNTHHRRETGGQAWRCCGCRLPIARQGERVRQGLAKFCILVLPVLTLGCIGPWRPSSEHLSLSSQTQEASRLAACLRANRMGRWVYERMPLPEKPGRESRLHVRQVHPGRISEGVLEDRPFLAIERYLDLKSEVASRPASASADSRPAAMPVEGQPSAFKRPRAPLKGGMGVFFRIAESADPIPVELEQVGAIHSETPVVYYEYRGIPQARGTLERCSEIEGLEDVDCPAGRFPGCVRVRVDLLVRFPWVAYIDLTTYLWLSAEVGEVRRVQRLSGWFLIFPFASADEYRLLSYTPPGNSTSAAALPPPLWKTGAVLLEGDYPGIRIGGMVIDLDSESPRP